MSTPASPTSPAAGSDPAKKAKIWMIVAIVLGLIAIGLAIWAVTTNSTVVAQWESSTTTVS